MHMDPEGRNRGTARCDLRTALPPTLNTTPSEGTWESSREAVATKDPILEELPELGPEVTCFFQRVSQELRRGRRKGALYRTPSERAW